MRRLTISLLALTGLCSLALGATGAFAAAPTIPLTTISQVTTGSVTLEADINPQGKAVGYRFEYGPEDCSSGLCASTPEGVLNAAISPVRVKAELKGLSAGTSYHFRAVAKNSANETANSPDRIFMTYLPPQEFGACPNDSLRKDNPAKTRIEYSSANLPDCRAYEQATPINKGGGDATGTVAFERASINGGAITFLSVSGVPGGKGSQELPVYLASRGAEGWSSQGLLPPAVFGQNANVVGWTPNFSDIYSKALKLGEPQRTTFLDSGGGALQAIVEPTPDLQPRFAGATTGGAQVLFESEVAIPSVPGALEGKSNLYLWDKGSNELSLAGVMNDGQAPAKGALAGPYDWIRGTSSETLAKGGAARRYYTQDEHVISAAGSAVYFTAAGSGQLYVRLNPIQEQSALDSEGNCTEPALACTVQVNASVKGNGTGPDGTDPAGTAPAAFMGASADGSKSLFTSSEMLTDDANTGPEQEPAAIERAHINGTNVEPAFLPTHASGVAVDGTHIYWVDLDTGAIARAKLDGSDIENEFITATDNPKGVAVDAEHVYWTNAAEEKGEGTIGRAKLGASGAEGVEQSFIAAAGNPYAMEVNAEHVYWTNSALNGQAKSFIGRAKVDGTEADNEFLEVFGEGERLPGIALDGSHIYWMGTNPLDISIIGRADLDGSNYIPGFLSIAANQEAEREPHGRGIAVNGSHLYWSAQATSDIGRAKLNGDEAASEKQLKFIKDANHPQGLAVDSSHIYWAANGEASPNPGNDLYRYDAQAKAISDLAPDSSSTNGAEVRGVLGTSEDGSYVYFAANGVPNGVTNSPNGRGESAEVGDCPLILASSQGGSCNLYLEHDGTIEFIARLGVGGSFTDAANWAATPTTFLDGNFQQTARVTPDGHTLLFRSQRQLTDYQSEGSPQLYLYRAGNSEVSCVSCNPTGLPPAEHVGEGFFGTISPSAVIPTPPAASLTHNLSTSGDRVFFETTDALVGADTNGDEICPPVGSALQQFPACTDIYEWEAQGSGACDAAHAVADGGCIYLISTGKGTEPALIADASGDGKDVFFFTRSQLVGQDEDELVDVYDARAGGGLAGQNEPPPNPCQSVDSCHSFEQQTEIPPPPKVPSSGNVKSKPPCAKGKHRVKGRCVAKHSKAKKHHKRGKSKANSKGRAGR